MHTERSEILEIKPLTKVLMFTYISKFGECKDIINISKIIQTEKTGVPQ